MLKISNAIALQDITNNKMKQMKKIFTLLIIAFSLLSCDNKIQKSEKTPIVTAKTVGNEKIDESVENEYSEEIVTYPKTGNKPSDFIPKINN